MLDRASRTRPPKRLRGGANTSRTAPSRGAGAPPQTLPKPFSRLLDALNTSRPTRGYDIYGKEVICVPSYQASLAIQARHQARLGTPEILNFRPELLHWQPAQRHTDARTDPSGSEEDRRYEMTTRANGGRTPLDRLAAAILAGVVLVAGNGSVLADGLFGSIRASAHGSAMMFRGSATILRGSGHILVAGSQFVIESVHATADGVILILRGVSEALRITLHVVGDSVISATTVAGTVLTVVATAAGQILHAGGHVVAFVPNTLGNTLVHSSAYGGQSRPLYGHGQAQPWNPPEDLESFEWGEQ